MDWYVDSAAAGTATGQLPADALISVMSLNTTSTNWGDHIWVRKTYLHDLGAGGTVGKASFNANSHTPVQIIGWPSAGDPWYAERPAAGTSAGWDADTGFFTGLNYPSLVTSSNNNATGWAGLAGNHWSNYVLVQSLGGGRFNTAWWATGIRHANAYILNGVPAAGSVTLRNIDDLTIITSTTGNIIAHAINVRKLTIPASTVATALVAGGPTNVFDIDVIDVQTSSLGWINLPSNDGTTMRQKIGRIYGTAPAVGVTSGSVGDDAAWGIYIDDYYGNGPIWPTPPGQWSMSINNTMVYSGTNATIFLANSVTGGTGGLAQSDLDRMHNAAVQIVSVTNGVPFVARMPLWTHRVSSLEAKGLEIHLMAKGCRPKVVRPSGVGSDDIVASSSGLWTGNSTAAGSAWMATAVFVPTETGTCYLKLGMLTTNTQSGCYYGHPPFFTVNSA